MTDLGMVPDSSLDPYLNHELNLFWCTDLNPFSLDHEGWGNPRVVNGDPDIGWDEAHGFLNVESWGNQSISHNLPTPLDPTAPIGSSSRLFLFDWVLYSDGMGGPGNVTIYGTVVEKDYSGPPGSPPPLAWTTTPPGTLTPAILKPSSPLDYQLKYVSSASNCPAPTAWSVTADVVPYQIPWNLAGQSFVFRRASVSDDETATPPGCLNPASPSHYFAFQAKGNETRAWSNMQFEYR
jgi:hypothetical protein